MNDPQATALIECASVYEMWDQCHNRLRMNVPDPSILETINVGKMKCMNDF